MNVKHYRIRTFQQEYLAFLKRHEHSTRCRLLMPGLSFDDNICGTDHDFDRPSGTGPFCIATQALRACLLSACPSGTKSSFGEAYFPEVRSIPTAAKAIIAVPDHPNILR
jgi:hypothetical protein